MRFNKEAILIQRMKHSTFFFLHSLHSTRCGSNPVFQKTRFFFSCYRLCEGNSHTYSDTSNYFLRLTITPEQADSQEGAILIQFNKTRTLRCKQFTFLKLYFLIVWGSTLVSTTHQNRFSPSIMWVPGKELRSASKHLIYLLSLLYCSEVLYEVARESL